MIIFFIKDKLYCKYIFKFFFLGIIANFKAHFRSHQYGRGIQRYEAGYEDRRAYDLDQVDAMWFLADAWLKVKVSTIENCWNHTNILQSKHCRELEEETNQTDKDFVLPPEEGLPLDDEVVQTINKLLSDLPGNNNITSIEELDLEANESDVIVTQPSYNEGAVYIGDDEYFIPTNNNQQDEDDEEEEEEEEQEKEEEDPKAVDIYQLYIFIIGYYLIGGSTYYLTLLLYFP